MSKQEEFKRNAVTAEIISYQMTPSHVRRAILGFMEDEADASFNGETEIVFGPDGSAEIETTFRSDQ